MFYRSVFLVLAVSTVTTIGFSVSPELSVAPTFLTGVKPVEHQSYSASVDDELKPELEAVIVSQKTAFVSTPTPISNKPVSNKPTVGPSCSVVHSVSSTATGSHKSPVVAEPTPVLATTVTNTKVTPPSILVLVNDSPSTYSAPLTVPDVPAHYESQHLASQYGVAQNAHQPATYADYYSNHVDPISNFPRHPALETEKYSLLEYRRMMIKHSAPHPSELQGTWQGTNKGIATLAIDKRFVKDFRAQNGQVYGDNVKVQQGQRDGWAPIQDQQTGAIDRGGKFLVQSPHGIGAFRHGAVLNYNQGGNRRLDPANLISDRVVKLDDNHMLGRAVAKFGPFEIPLSYFVLQRTGQ